MKAEKGVAPSKKISAYFVSSAVNQKDVGYICKLASVESVEFVDNKNGIEEKLVSLFGDFGEIAVPLGDLVDVEKEVKRLPRRIRYYYERGPKKREDAFKSRLCGESA